MRPLALSFTVLFALIALAVLTGNGASRPLEEHEVYVARTATEIGRSGQWLVPHFNDAPRLEKPPLAYWAALGTHALLAHDATDVVSEFEARLPAVLAGLLLVWVTYALAWHAWGDRRAGFAAAAMWATSAGFYTYSHNARPEMLYALFCGLALLGFVRLARGVGRVWANALGAWLAITLALLTKGPFLPVFIIAGIVLALVWQRRRDPAVPGIAATLRPGLGVVVVIALAGMYFAMVVQRVPGALEFWRAQMFNRTGGVGGASLAFLTLPWLRQTPQLLLPWLLPIPFAAVLAWRSPRIAVRMLACAFAVALLCLSFARRAHGFYALPVLPAAFALMGGAVMDIFDRWSLSAPQRLLRVLQIHAALAAFATITVTTLALHGVSLPMPVSRSAAFGLCALGLVVAALALRAADSKPQQAFVFVAIAFACTFAAASVGTLGWESSRLSKAAFARQLPRDVPLASMRGGSLETAVYYADRHVDELSESGLAAWLAAHPDGLVIVRSRDLAEGRVRGKTLLLEAASAGNDPIVLVNPRAE
jgi:4-amino-4-deoxy-L-arabinose transferase-like glycosyltransferase